MPENEKMNPEVKDKWVKALRSGEYAQCAGALARVEGGKTSYCCLGVLSEIAAKEGVIDTAFKDSSDYGDASSGYIIYDDSSALLPRSVSEWAGIAGHNNDWEAVEIRSKKYGRNTLTEFNDNGKSFSEVADIIEECL